MKRLSLFTFLVMTHLASVAYADNVKLAWDRNTETNLAGYRIYRTEQQGVYTSQPLNGSPLITTTSWTDSTVKNNHTYYYVVRAVNTSALESNNSNQVMATVRAGRVSLADTALPDPDLFTDVASFSGVTDPFVETGRIYSEIQGPANTAITINNPNTDPVTLDFYFTDEAGVELYSNRTSIPGHGQVAGFLSETPFAPPDGISLSSARTFTFLASAPIAVTAVRGFINERSEFLTVPLPIADLDSAGFPILFPHNVFGDSWDSEIQLVNPTNSVLSGAISSFSADYPLSPTAEWFYEIAPRSAFSLRIAGAGSRPRVEYVRVTALDGTPAPSGLLILSFHDSGATISQTAVKAVSETK
jgi:hypothetical protein